MTLKEFSKMFNMSVNEMCEFTGFSRQGLNEIVKGNSTKNGVKKRMALHGLRDRTLDLKVADMKAANKEYEARMKAIDEIFN